MQVLKGDVSNLSGILDQGRFDHNYKQVSKLYEEYVLSEGDFDEKIFLGKIFGNLIMFILS
jgi:retinoblastoma-like protein 1